MVPQTTIKISGGREVVTPLSSQAAVALQSPLQVIDGVLNTWSGWFQQAETNKCRKGLDASCLTSRDGFLSMGRLAAFLFLIWTGSQLTGALVFEIHIRVVQGRSVTLPCRAPSMADPIKYLEWSRTDQKMSYIILYRDQHFYPDFQDRAFRDRAALLDKEMKEGEVSLLLKNATAADSGGVRVSGGPGGDEPPEEVRPDL
ncbi:uncharacterized protein FYW61_019026 [Anableps anableps]